MLTVQRLPLHAASVGVDEDTWHDALTATRFRYGVAFLDLDHKHSTKMVAYRALDRAVVDAMAGLGATGETGNWGETDNGATGETGETGCMA